MRTRARVDANQPEIVEAFRAMGCDVLHTHQLGKGAPDLVVSYSGISLMVECKAEKGKLTKAQETLYSTLRTRPRLVRNVDEVRATFETLERWHHAIRSMGVV
jgi:hypothetical protein